MKRRVKGVDFARIWGEVKAWGQQDRDDLMALLLNAPPKTAEAKKREPRKPKGGALEGVKP